MPEPGRIDTKQFHDPKGERIRAGRALGSDQILIDLDKCAGKLAVCQLLPVSRIACDFAFFENPCLLQDHRS